MPQRALLFGLVGASGVVVHLAGLKLAWRCARRSLVAQAGAALLAMTSNFLINNAVTYRDRRLAGGAACRRLRTLLPPCAPSAWWPTSRSPISCIGSAGLVARRRSPASPSGAAWNYVSTAAGVWRD